MLLPDLKSLMAPYVYLQQYNISLSMKDKVLHNLVTCLTLQACLLSLFRHHLPATMNYWQLPKFNSGSHPTPVFSPGKSRERRSLVGYSPWGQKEWDTTQRLNFQLSNFMPSLKCSSCWEVSNLSFQASTKASPLL